MQNLVTREGKKGKGRKGREGTVMGEASGRGGDRGEIEGSWNRAADCLRSALVTF